MRPLTETAIWASLLDCYDLQLPCNIVDLGLVLGVTITEDQEAPGAGIPGIPPSCSVSVDVIPVHPDEAEEAHLRAQIANRVAGIEGVSQITVRVHHAREWSPNLISDRGPRALCLTGNPSLVQITHR